MKKLVGVILTILSCGAAYSLPLGNPSEASLLYNGLFLEGRSYDCSQHCICWWDGLSLRFGYYGDFVFNRHLEVDETNNGDDIEKSEIYTDAVYFTVNFWNKIDFFTTVGASKLFLKSNALTFNGPNGDRLTLETQSDFSWSVGARFTFLECGRTVFGAEGQYFYAKPHVNRVTIADSDSAYPTKNVDYKYSEWQIGFGFSHRIWNLVPYMGAKLSGVKVDSGNARVLVGASPIILHDLENRFEGGIVFGVSFVACQKMALTIETRFPDEKALYLNGQIRF